MNSKSTVFAACLAVLTASLVIGAIYSNAMLAGSQLPTRSDDAAPAVVRFTESFDGVTVPNLPAGWTTSRTGNNSLFVTNSLNPNTPPNAAFTSNPATAGSAELVSPSITLGSSLARIVFRHAYQTDFRIGSDGGVLEVSVNGAAFQDIIAAGGVFVGGAYSRQLDTTAAGNPLAGRQAWTGESSGYVTTIVNLPQSFANQSVQFRWRYGTNNEWDGPGWRIDTVVVEDYIPIVAAYSENFDAVTSPNLPIGWTTQQTDPVRAFTTQTDLSHNGQNSVFTPALAGAGLAAIISPPIRVGANSPKLIFHHHYSCEGTHEGGVLEISVNGGPFQDILDAGGTFVHGGYNATLRESPNPLSFRRAWTGSTNGFIYTEVNLPPSTYRQNVRFKWAFGTDAFILSAGWWVDAVQVTEDLSGQSLNAITIPAAGSAQPYPSEIQVSNHAGIISHVQVNLVDFTHSSPDDVDLMLVSPSGRKVILMSDVGGNNPVSNLDLSFDDVAPISLPDNAPLTQGFYKPTNYEPGDVFASPAPATLPDGNTLGVLNGSDPNGTWKLFLVDDNGNNAGDISGGWSLSINSTPDMVTIPSTGTAAPYPSEHLVSGLEGSVAGVTVHLSNFSHTSPDDVDVLLAAPNGRRVVIMSDVGGTNEIGGRDLTISDAAPTAMPDSGPLAGNLYKPTNFEPGDAFPSPAPQTTTTGSNLGTFFGVPPNGAWKLYVVDDSGQSIGSFSGEWSLDLQTSTGACLFSISPSVQAFPVAGGTGEFSVNIPSGCAWTAATPSSFTTITSGAAGDGSGAVAFSVASNMGTGRTATITVSNGVTSRAFQVQQASGCPFSLAQSNVSVSPAGGAASVNVTAGVICNWQASTSAPWIQIASTSQNGNGTLTFNALANNSGTPRSGTITIGAQTLTVHQSTTGRQKFDFDGDGKADVSVYRPSDGKWWILNSSQQNYTEAQWGAAGDKITPGDFDGDGKTDFAVYRGGIWYILQSQTGTVWVANWGTASDIPIAADFDGNGTSELSIFRPSDGYWWVLNKTGTHFGAQFGQTGDKPVTGDYDGDGKADLAVYRSPAGAGQQATWFILRSATNSVASHQFGSAGDQPVPADYDGNGSDNVAVYRPSTGFWYTSLDPANGHGAVQWGAAGDLPAPADFTGDGKADIAVYRNGVWYVLESGSGAARIANWGSLGDRPTPSAFIF